MSRPSDIILILRHIRAFQLCGGLTAFLTSVLLCDYINYRRCECKMTPKPTRKIIVTTNRISFRFIFPPHFLFFQNSHCVQNSNYGTSTSQHSFPHSHNTKSAKNQVYTLNPKSNHYILHDNLFCRFCYFNRVHQLRRFICHQNYICASMAASELSHPFAILPASARARTGAWLIPSPTKARFASLFTI